MKIVSYLLLALLLTLGTASAAPLPAGPVAFTTTDGVALYVRVAGRGVPCVFVHGGPGAGSAAVEKLAGPLLEQHFQMIYLDQRGSGRSASAPAPDAYGLARQVQDLEELRQRLRLERWTLLAHSFGGLIATAYARQYPERVQGLVLANALLSLTASMESTAAAGYALLPAATRPPLDPAAPLPQRFGMVLGLLSQQGLMPKLSYADDSTAARVRRATRGLPANQALAGALFRSPALVGPYLEDFAPATARLAMPVLVLSGQADYVVGPDHYRSFRFPHQRVLTLPGRHNALLENQPAVGQALADFCRTL